MGKALYKCCICHKLGKINICRICSHEFCDKCLDKVHEGVKYENTWEKGDSRINYVNYCAFKCMGSKSDNSCFDCGENYIHMRKCLCCQMVFCTNCNKKNLYHKKQIFDEELYSGKSFCSKSCYEIYIEEPNNRWLICEDCGNDYYDIGYKKKCDLCLHKHNYHKNILFSNNRKSLVNNLVNYSIQKVIEIHKIELFLNQKMLQECKNWSNVSENKVTLNMWLTNKNIGYNLCYNIWDEVVDNYLNYNYLNQITDV